MQYLNVFRIIQRPKKRMITFPQCGIGEITNPLSGSLHIINSHKGHAVKLLVIEVLVTLLYIKKNNKVFLRFHVYYLFSQEIKRRFWTPARSCLRPTQSASSGRCVKCVARRSSWGRCSAFRVREELCQ